MMTEHRDRGINGGVHTRPESCTPGSRPFRSGGGISLWSALMMMVCLLAAAQAAWAQADVTVVILENGALVSANDDGAELYLIGVDVVLPGDVDSTDPANLIPKEPTNIVQVYFQKFTANPTDAIDVNNPIDPALLPVFVPVVNITTEAQLDAITLDSMEVLIINAGDGDDWVEYRIAAELEISLRLFGEGGNDVLVGGPGEDFIRGGDGNDYIDGGDGDDQTDKPEVPGLAGGNGDDVIYGGSGDDTIDGEWGNDFIRTGCGDDIASGGGDYDMIDYSHVPRFGINADLAAGTVDEGGVR